MRLAITRRVCYLIGAAALASAFVSACGSGGVNINSAVTNGVINQRHNPVVHFPMPIETFNEVTNAYELDNIVIFAGRTAPSPNAGQAQWAEPETNPIPISSNAFSFKPGTDVWETHASEDRNTNNVVDETDGWGTFGWRQRGQSMSVVCQWLFQDVIGNPRNDGPMVYENVEFQSIAVSLIGPLTGTNPVRGRNTQKQNPVSDRLGLRGALASGEDVPTDNEHVANNTVPMPGSASHMEFGLATSAPPAILFGKWQETEGENNFVESMNRTLVNAPVSGFFSSNGQQTLSGGIYCNRLSNNVTPSYNPNLNIAFYYSGVCLGHVMGLGMGIPQVSYQRPGGAGSGEEGIMSVQVELDQSFFTTAGRRFQYTVQDLLYLQNNQRFPLGSTERADAEFLSLQDPFNPNASSMTDNAPGPMR